MSTGSVKVMLLLLGIVSFAAVWSNDQRPVSPQSLAIAEKTEGSDRGEQPSAASQIEWPVVAFPESERQVDVIDSQDWLSFPVALHSTIPELTRPNQTESSWVMLDEIEFVRIDAIAHPLPRAIAPGDYRVIDRFGNVSEQSISLEIAIATGFAAGSDARDSYTARELENRWHYIRIERDRIADSDDSNLNADVRKAWKSVFQVLGQQAGRPIQNLRRPIENWLSPEEIADDRSTVRR